MEQKHIVTFLAVVGAAQLIVQAAQTAVPKLDEWADRTEPKWDDEAVSRLAQCLRVLSSALGILSKVLSPIAARKP